MDHVKQVQSFCCQCGDQLTAAETNGAHIKALRARERKVTGLVRDAQYALSMGNTDAAAKFLRKAQAVERVKVEEKL